MTKPVARTGFHNVSRTVVSTVVGLGFSLLLTGCGGSSNQAQVNPLPPLPIVPAPSYTGAIDYIESLNFSGAVLVKKDGVDIVRQGFGQANVADGIDNTVETKFRVGSVSKPITALGVMMQQRQGLLQTSQTVSEFDETFPQGERITLAHLLSHHSGIRDHLEILSEYGDVVPADDTYELIKQDIAVNGLKFTPGEFFDYSNSNYLMLGLLVGELGQEGYHNTIRNELLTPLGMDNTEPGENVPSGADYARGYKNGEVADAYPMAAAFAAGDWVSTVTDLEKLADAILDDSLLTDEEKQQVFAEEVAGMNNYGFGWMTARVDGDLVYWHGGNIDGFTSMLAIFPETNSMVIALSNEHEANEKQENLIQTMAKQQL